MATWGGYEVPGAINALSPLRGRQRQPELPDEWNFPGPFDNAEPDYTPKPGQKGYDPRQQVAQNALAGLPGYVDPTAGVNGVGNALGINPNRNMTAANTAMRLTPQEMALYQHHLDNLQKGGVQNPNGSTSTLYQLSFDENGKTYNIPTIYGNTKLSPDDAIAFARKIGLDKFPSYGSGFQAENRYQRMHNYLERDTDEREGGR